jgi:hypothetical protein
MGNLMLIMLLILTVVISATVGLTILAYRFLKTRRINKAFRILAFIPVFTVVYFIYTAFYPLDEFYEEDFTEVTTLPFPKSGKIMAKSPSYPDQFGDYSSCSLIELNEKEFENLISTLPVKGFSESKERWGSDELFYIEKRIGDKKYLKRVERMQNDKYLFIGFLDDRKTIICFRTSS